MKQFVFSIDIEDWFQVENLKEKMFYHNWSIQESRIDIGVKAVLEIFKKNGIKATFFILGWIADRKPDLVRCIADHGHEIACHGYKHELLHRIDGSTIESDISRSLEILTPLSYNTILGYRAPSFSITKAAAQILKKMNFKYDASLNDFQFNKRYGKLVICNKVNRINEYDMNYTALENDLIEFPISVNTYFGIYWPLGGGYFRLSPMWFLKMQLRDTFEKRDIVSMYLHPWEFDPGQPRIRGLNTSYYFRHYYGLEKTKEKFERFIGLVKSIPSVEIKTFGDIIDRIQS